MVTFPSTALKLSKSKRVPRAPGQPLRRWVSPCPKNWTSQPQARTQGRPCVPHMTIRAPSKTENAALPLEAHLRSDLLQSLSDFWGNTLRASDGSHSLATSPSRKRPVWAAVIPETLIHHFLRLSICDTLLSIPSVLSLDLSLLQEGKFGQH